MQLTNIRHQHVRAFTPMVELRGHWLVR